MNQHYTAALTFYLICGVTSLAQTVESANSSWAKVSGVRIPVFHESGPLCAELLIPSFVTERKRIGFLTTSMNRPRPSDTSALTLHMARLDAASWPRVSPLLTFLSESGNRSGSLIIVRSDGARETHSWDSPPRMTHEGALVFTRSGRTVRLPLFQHPGTLSAQPLPPVPTTP